MNQNPPVAAFWFRRDLRLNDNTGLHHALKSGLPVLPVFIFDREILDLLPRKDARVEFIHLTLTRIKAQLEAMGSSLRVEYGKPTEVWPRLAAEYNLAQVFTNHDYEPYARDRDQWLKDFFGEKGIAFHTFKDQVLLEKQEVLSNSGTPYTVFTPYSRKWREALTPEHLAARETAPWFSHFLKMNPRPMIGLAEMDFEEAGIPFPSGIPDSAVIRQYHEQRNFPAKNGVTRMGLHLRFGTISIRQLAASAKELNETYLNELIWREFYMQILWNFPHVAGRSFRPEYDAVPWRNNEAEFKKWCEGKTGFPLVDAGMRELNATGYMHNRVRMVVASFLTKHLLIDWRWGEAYFAEKLLDFELSSNNGGWQWASGSGTDAAPYFRIFNPEEQFKKFDPEAKYVRKWVTEYGTPLYPRPVVDHKFARERCLEAYKVALAPAKAAKG